MGRHRPADLRDERYGRAHPGGPGRQDARANEFGKGYQARTQMFYAAMSYFFHLERPPDLTERTRQLQATYTLFPYVEGTHMPCSFGHLDGYSACTTRTCGRS